MRLYRNNTAFFVSGRAFLLAALFLLILPLKWLAAAFLAALWHEFCHWLAVRALGGKVNTVRVSSNGAILEAQLTSAFRSLLCILAGPLGSLGLLLFAKWIPRLALCGAVQGIYNLLPIYPLDGGRAVRLLAFLLLKKPYAEGCCILLEWLVRSLIIGITIWAVFLLDLGPMPLFACLLFLFKTKSEKSLANGGFRGYNSPTIDKRYDYDGFAAKNPPRRSKTGPLHGRGV